MSFSVLADGAARDEAWWRQVAALYPAPPDAIVNLEHGYFGAMAAPVQVAFEQAVRYTNEQLSPFVRGEFTRTHVDILRRRLARDDTRRAARNSADAQRHRVHAEC